jgi:ribosome maturation factor RimP
MAYFCTCKKCKNFSQSKQGHFLKTKRTYKKHQEAELRLQNSLNDLSSTETNITKSDNDNVTMEIDSSEEEDISSNKQVLVSQLFQIKNSLR